MSSAGSNGAQYTSWAALLMAVLDPTGDLQQSRSARLCLAFIEADPLLAATVWAELAADPRGQLVALQALVTTLVEALVGMWTVNVEPEVVATRVREMLAEQIADKEQS